MDGMCIAPDPQEVGLEYARASKKFIDKLNSNPEFKEQAKQRLKEINKKQWLSNIDVFYQQHTIEIVHSKEDVDLMMNKFSNMSISEFLCNIFPNSNKE